MDDVILFLSEHDKLVTSWTAILAVFISLVSVFIALINFAMQRADNRKALLPIGNLSLGDYENHIFVRLRNDGVGPMIVDHIVVKRIANRSRWALDVRDEYDVQDLLQAILRGLFDDVRSEEYTPSYAGSSRIDFLLKSQQIAIEVKFASAALRDKQIGEQLLVDIGRYQSHPDCRRLICFV